MHYHCDTETTGLDCFKNDIIEISFLRAESNEQKTWLIQPINFDSIQLDALKVNGHKLEDLKHETKYGLNYRKPSDVIIEIENWLAEDNLTSEDRFLIGHNISFDQYFMKFLWSKCNSSETFPFGRKILDTLQQARFIDKISNTKRDSYSQVSLAKEFGIKIEKAHSAADDTRVNKLLFDKQEEQMKKYADIICNK
jgi:DNA polymerase III alpha subunit (gram-positive type)